jgi:hypothetical protein
MESQLYFNNWVLVTAGENYTVQERLRKKEEKGL